MDFKEDPNHKVFIYFFVSIIIIFLIAVLPTLLFGINFVGYDFVSYVVSNIRRIISQLISNLFKFLSL